MKKTVLLFTTSKRGVTIKYLNRLFLLLLLLSQLPTMAQEAVLSSGGNASGNGASVSYSLGQLVNETYIGTNGKLTLGVQQPFEIQVINGTEDNKINLFVKVYPNPTTNVLTLKVDNFDFTNALIQLYDVEGKLLLSKIMTTDETLINMQSFTPALYILKITDNQKVIKSFKIIKN